MLRAWTACWRFVAAISVSCVGLCAAESVATAQWYRLPSAGNQLPAGYDPLPLPRVVPVSYTENDLAPALPGGGVAASQSAGEVETNDGDGCCDGCASHACDRWYVGFSGGWQQRAIVHEVGDPQTFIIFDSGFAANACLGYRFDAFRVEAEYSFMNNEVQTAGSGGLSSPSSGNINLRALMFNVYHDFNLPNWCCWKPYLGAGIGIYQSEINSMYPDFFDVIGAPFAGTPINCTSDMPFAYQFRVGASRPIGERTEFYAGYRFFRGEKLEFASEPFASPTAHTFSPDGATNHAIEFGLRVRF